MIIRKIIVVKVISRDIYKLYGTFIKNENIQKKKKKLKDWKVVAFYNFQQYATHLNVLIIPKKIKMKVDNLWEYSHYEGELKKLCFHSLKKKEGMMAFQAMSCSQE